MLEARTEFPLIDSPDLSIVILTGFSKGSAGLFAVASPSHPSEVQKNKYGFSPIVTESGA